MVNSAADGPPRWSIRFPDLFETALRVASGT